MMQKEWINVMTIDDISSAADSNQLAIQNTPIGASTMNFIQRKQLRQSEIWSSIREKDTTALESFWLR